MRFWRYLTAVVMGFGAGALYGWSALAAPLQQAFDVRTAEIGMVFSIALVSFTVAVLLAPAFTRLMGSDRVLAVGALAAALCTTLAAFAPNFALFVALFSVGFGTASGLLYSTVLTIAAQSPRPQLVTPMFVTVFGLGGVVFGPVWKILAAADWGLTALLPLSALLLIASLLAWFTGNRKTVDGVQVKQSTTDSVSASASASVSAPAKSATPGQLLHIWLIFASGAFAGLMVLGLAAEIIEAGPSTLFLTSAVLAGVALANTTGRLSGAAFGKAADSPLNGLHVSALITLVGLTTVLLAPQGLAVGIGLVLIAGGYGLLASTITMLTARQTRPADFQRHFGLVFTAWGAAGFVAPWLSGIIFDRYGDFSLAYLIAVSTTVALALLVWGFRRRL
ncbi:MAG: hypothetical protein CBC49_001425 [Alphaproteobacteria bacterium TMED89]|nr:MAG: hypothetical protein CBC49_001425 [Alphaproteobacteria bacterium TMED89]